MLEVPNDRRDGGDAREHQNRERENQHRQHRHLHVVGVNLLAEVFRRPAHHQSSDEDREDDEDQHAIEPAPTPPKITSPSMMLSKGTSPPSGV